MGKNQRLSKVMNTRGSMELELWGHMTLYHPPGGTQGYLQIIRTLPSVWCFLLRADREGFFICKNGGHGQVKTDSLGCRIWR